MRCMLPGGLPLRLVLTAYWDIFAVRRLLKWMSVVVMIKQNLFIYLVDNKLISIYKL